MGKVLVFKDATFADHAIEQLSIAVEKPVVQIDVAGLVTITSNYDCYYTTDGSTPSTASNPYNQPFTVTIGTTVKAIAVLGGNTSEVVSAYYDGSVPAPTITVASAMATITSPYPCYYTLDGSTPDNTSTPYTTPFAVSDGDIIKAVAYTNDTYSQVTEKAIAMMTFNKKLKTNGTLEDDEGICVSPFFVVGSKGDSITWNWNVGGNSGRFSLCEYSEQKQVLGDGWNTQSSGLSRTFALYYSGVYYARASFVMGTPGSVVNNTTGQTVFEYDGSTS